MYESKANNIIEMMVQRRHHSVGKSMMIRITTIHARGVVDVSATKLK